MTSPINVGAIATLTNATVVSSTEGRWCQIFNVKIRELKISRLRHDNRTMDEPHYMNNDEEYKGVKSIFPKSGNNMWKQQFCTSTFATHTKPSKGEFWWSQITITLCWSYKLLSFHSVKSNWETEGPFYSSARDRFVVVDDAAFCPSGPLFTAPFAGVGAVLESVDSIFR